MTSHNLVYGVRNAPNKYFNTYQFRETTMIDPEKIEQNRTPVHESMPKGGSAILGKISRKKTVKTLQSQADASRSASREDGCPFRSCCAPGKTGAAGATPPANWKLATSLKKQNLRPPSRHSRSTRVGRTGPDGSLIYDLNNALHP